jgi:hypothetical protein
MPRDSVRKKAYRITALILIMGAIAAVLCLPDSGPPKLPVELFVITGYTNDQGFRVTILVTNLHSSPLECAVSLDPRIPPGTGEVHYTPYAPEDKIGGYNLPQMVKWVEVPWGAKPELYVEGDQVAHLRKGTMSEIAAHEAARFSVLLWPTNETLVVVQYRAPASGLQKARLALARWLNIGQSRLLNRRRLINFRTWDDRPYRIATTVHGPVVTNRGASTNP